MPVTYPTALKNARLAVVRDAIDAGGEAGRLEIGTAGMTTVLATIRLTQPCAIVADGTLVLLGAPLSTAATSGGKPAAARFRNSNGKDCVTGLTVGTRDADIIIDSPIIVVGQTVRVTSGSITHA